MIVWSNRGRSYLPSKDALFTLFVHTSIQLYLVLTKSSLQPTMMRTVVWREKLFSTLVAKVRLTLSAIHVEATLTSFDSRFAARADGCVRCNPVQRRFVMTSRSCILWQPWPLFGTLGFDLVRRTTVPIAKVQDLGLIALRLVVLGARTTFDA